jgi:NAD(P)-dependent dehydrogenase (short-subunit alcohol dehydrogenase family)
MAYRRARQEADEPIAEVRAKGRQGLALQADLRQPAASEAVVEGTAEALGRLDVLVNMASIYTSTPFDALTVDQWDDQLDVEVRASWLCARAAVPYMRRAGGGRIINVSDWIAASRRPRYENYLAYYVAKAGVIALTEVLALELAADQILVNAIAPGPIAAPDGTTDDEYVRIAHATPLGRWGGELEIAKAVLGLIDADFITGETIRVDGGRHLR